MKYLVETQKQMYQTDGYVSPVDIFSSDEIAEIRKELEMAEATHGDRLRGPARNNPHLVLPVLDRITHETRILDAVEDLIGHDILVSSTTLFIKEPSSDGFISWHQDARYVHMEPYNWVTAWLAISDVDEENGCMYMMPGTQNEGMKTHEDTYDENNALTRGQTILDIDLSAAKPVELRAGQISFHHPLIIHGSGPNRSNRRRIGFAIQSYIGGNVEQKIGQIHVQQARGDKAQKHVMIPRLNGEMQADDMARRDAANEALGKVFYHGAKKIGRY